MTFRSELRSNVLYQLRTLSCFPNELVSLIESYVEYHPFLSLYKYAPSPHLKFIVLSKKASQPRQTLPRRKFEGWYLARRRSWNNVLSTALRFNTINYGYYMMDDENPIQCYLVSYVGVYKFSCAIEEEPTQEQCRELRKYIILRESTFHFVL